MKMGWKDGQGIGPKLRRKARLEMRTGDAHDGGDTHLFAPDNVPMIQFDRKTDRKGLGHQGEARLTSLRRSDVDNDDDEDDLPIGLKGRPSVLSTGRSKPGSGKTGMGVGILNDNGSDEDDPYEMGPKIRYNRVIGGDKKKKTKKAAVTNPLLKNAPTFVPKTARAKNSLRRCHDGRLPLDGFVLAREIEDLTAALAKYAPPSVPQGWKSAKTSTGQASNSNYISTADAAKASSLDPRSRAALLGEKSLPGKSVFDYISSTARDKLAAASGRSDLPPARGEIGDGHALSEEEGRQALLSRVPSLDRETALAAISRSAGGPYADNAAKKARYRAYLEHQANSTRPMPSKPPGMSDGEFLGEMTEFYNCARIFKPMTGFMASRFTTAKTSSTASNSTTPSADLVSKPEPKITDPAEEAAKMGMFGQMTRSTEDFYPTRLLCKRFNVMAPAHSQPDNEANSEPRRGRGPDWPSMSFPDLGAPSQPSAGPMEEGGQSRSQGTSESPAVGAIEAPKPEVEVNPDKNDAVEGKAAHEDVLRAIFGDSDSE
jgi:G patch domain-containing protein 1